MICSMFKHIKEKNNPYNAEVTQILDAIKSGKWKSDIDRLRVIQEKEKRRELKDQLTSVCFSGVFSARFDEKIISHSGLAVLDFDHVVNPIELKTRLCEDKHTFACFISPSGDGVKCIMKIPAEPLNHENYYSGLIQRYPSVDPSCRNVSRVCYVSYDPDLYYNPNAIEFNTMPEKELKLVPVQAQNTDYKKLAILADMIRNASDGEKHHELIRASRLAGGFIAGGMIEESMAYQTIELEINKRDINDFNGAKKTIYDGIEYGKKDPIYQETFIERIKQAKQEEIIDTDEPTARDVIYLESVRQNIVYSFEHGTSRGETTHFDEIDKIYRMARKELTVVHGIANHGKSAWLLQMCLIKSIKDGKKWGVFSPENYPAEEFYKDLIHTFVGKSTEKHHHNQMSIGELNAGMDFIRDHFFFMFPESNEPTPKYINMRFQEMIIKHGIDGCIIDPYNQLDTNIKDTGGKEHLYLSAFLSMEKKFAVDNDVFMFIVTHPNAGLEQQKNGSYKKPNVYSLSGGAMWNNKSDNIICVHRPNVKDQSDKTVYIESQKIKKQKLNGVPGLVELSFDRITSRYYDSNGYSPLGTWVQQTYNEIQPLNKEYRQEKIDVPF